jgi:SOS-response transcriptional repressor LexA
MDKPTKKQTLLLEFINDFTKLNNYSPSYREIMAALNLKSVSAVAEHIDNCVAAGFLKRVPGTARSLEIVPPLDYTQTIELFHIKIHELEQKSGTKEDIQTLRSAAKLLEIDL